MESEHAADDVELRPDEVLAQLDARHVRPDEVSLEGLGLPLVVLELVVVEEHSVVALDRIYQRLESQVYSRVVRDLVSLVQELPYIASFPAAQVQDG